MSRNIEMYNITIFVCLRFPYSNIGLLWEDTRGNCPILLIFAPYPGVDSNIMVVIFIKF